MLPTLAGRLQTRFLLLLTVGVAVTLAITPLLPGNDEITDRYMKTYGVLLWVAIFAAGWELVYHFVMQWRWEKDWPTLFGLLTGIPEGLLIGLLVIPDGPLWGAHTVPAAGFVIHFSTVWLTVWIVSNGPLRVLFVHWRFQGGRII